VAHRLGGRGVKGILVKAASGHYRLGQRGWFKRKMRTTVDLAIGGVIGSTSRPRALLLGEMTSGGRFAYRGLTLPLTRIQSDEVGQLSSSTVSEVCGERVAQPSARPVG
jgi:hypothetical protein